MHCQRLQIPFRENFSLFWFSCNSMILKETLTLHCTTSRVTLVCKSNNLRSRRGPLEESLLLGKRSLLFRKTGYILFLQCLSHCVQKEYSRGLGKNRHKTPSAAHIRGFQIPLRENFSLFWFSCNSMFKKEDPDPALYYK